MIINHHFRVEIKAAHNFNSSTINKRFLPPVISISPVTFLSPTGLGHYQLIDIGHGYSGPENR